MQPISTSESMQHAQLLANAKREVEAYVTSKGSSGLSGVAAQRKAAALFYEMTERSTSLGKASVRQLIGIYNRFGESDLRPTLERVFRVSELAALVGKTDEVVKVAIALKEGNPDMTREELLARLNKH